MTTARDQLEILRRDDASSLYTRWREAATYFRDRARAGEDIACAEQALIDCFRDSCQVPVMEPCAEALARQRLMTADLSGLERLVRRASFQPYMLRALATIAALGTSVALAIPCLLEHLARHEHVVLDALAGHCVARPDGGRTLAELGSEMARRPDAHARVGGLAIRLLRLDAAVAPLLPVLAAQLEGGRPRGLAVGAARSLGHLAERGVSLQAITPRLLATLGRGNAEARRAVARALAIDGLARGDDALVDRVVEHRCAVERRGGVAALDLALNARGHASDRHMTRLARRLVDRSPAVRILARAALRAAARAGRRSVPPSPALAELVARMRRRALQGFLRETLQELAERDPQAAAVIEAHARAHPWRAREPYASLRRACEDVLGGSEARPCAICRYLPRSQLYSAARSLPAEFSRLWPVEADAHRLGASAEAPEGTLLRCPECGAYYRHQHVEESIDINWIEVEITVERLLPRRALELLRGAARDAYRAGLEALVAANRRRLRHPRREVRVDATWFITRHELARGELASALTLLADEEEAVRLETLEALLACGARAPEPALTTALRRALGDESAKVRERASRLLVQTCEVESLASLLEHARAEVRGCAAARLRDELAAGRVEPAVALALARPLLHAPESPEYEAGLGVLKAVATRPGWTEPAVAALVELAEDPARPDERRIQALYRLSWLVGDGVELTPVVPALAALLEQPALRWAVHDTLRGAQNHGADIGAAAPALTRLLEQPAVSFRGAIAGTLRRWEDEGGCLDAATPTIARGLADPDDDELRYTCVDLIRRRLDRGEYVREAIPPLERCVDDDARYFRETGAELLARVLCGLGEHAALCELLARAGPIVRGGALAGVARELGRGDGSIAESVSDALLDALLEHMDHEGRYVREQAETSLRRLAARGPEARARLQARARARGAWTQLATLLGATP